MESYRFFQDCQYCFRRFGFEFCSGFAFPLKKFIMDMVYGIISSQSICIAKIARALREMIHLDKVAKRLIYHLDKPNLGERILIRLHQHAAQFLASQNIAILDITDIQKPYAKATEALREVRDGSKKTQGKGFWLLTVIVARGRDIIPLHMKLYSFLEAKSENLEILQSIKHLQQDINKQFTWVIDRAGDRNNIIAPLLDQQRTFVIRCHGDRNLLVKTPQGLCKANMLDLARATPFDIKVHAMKRGELKIKHASLNQVSLPCRPEEILSLVTIHGRGARPLMFLTNLKGENAKEIITNTLNDYYSRWRIEELFRHIKTQYFIEKINVRRLIRLKNLIVLLLVAMFCIYVEMGTYIALKGMALFRTHERKTLRKPPSFIYYAVTVIVWLALGCYKRKALNRIMEKTIPIQQLPLFNTS